MTDGGKSLAAFAQSLAFFSVEGGGVLYDKRLHRLYALNLPAGFTWLCVVEGLGRAESVARMVTSFGLDVEVAGRWFDLAITQIEALRRASPPANPWAATVSPTRGPIEPDCGTQYRLMGRRFSVSGPQDALARIDALLANCVNIEAAGTGDTVLRIAIERDGPQWVILACGKEVGRCDDDALAPQVERQLVQLLVPGVPHVVALHAAALQKEGRTVLLAGPSGVGKTTLCLALVRAGWTFATDELVLVAADGSLEALPFPPCVKADAFTLVGRWFPALEIQPVHSRYGKTVRYLPLRARALPRQDVTVWFPKHRPGETISVRRIDTFDGLEKLLAQCIFVPTELRDADVDGLLRWHAQVRYFTLAYEDTDAAVRQFDCLMR